VRLPAFSLALPLLLSGCAAASTAAVNSAGPVSGAAAALGVSAVTANPFVAYAAGVGVNAAVTALEKYLSRKLKQGEQDKIAAAVGKLNPGQEMPWEITHFIPIDEEHGNLTVTRVINSPLATCKEVAFTIITSKDPKAPRPVYITTACQEPGGLWKWAEAEPSAERWGFLQ
jgi:hypothetical protein